MAVEVVDDEAREIPVRRLVRAATLFIGLLMHFVGLLVLLLGAANVLATDQAESWRAAE
jgi:uncharacterized membrane protein